MEEPIKLTVEEAKEFASKIKKAQTLTRPLCEATNPRVRRAAREAVVLNDALLAVLQKFILEHSGAALWN